LVMIEAGDGLPRLRRAKSAEVAGELVSRVLLEIEQEAGERAAESQEKVGGQRRPQGFKAETRPEEPTLLETTAEITARHRILWDKVSKKLVTGLRKTDPKEGLERLKVVKLAGDILSVIVKGQRQAWGIEAIEGEFPPGDTQEIIAEMASLTAPSRADASLERE